MTAQPEWEPRVDDLETRLNTVSDQVELYGAQWRAVGEIAVEGRRLAKATTPALSLVHKDVKAHFEEFKALRQEFTTFRTDTGERLGKIEDALTEVLRRLPNPDQSGES